MPNIDTSYIQTIYPVVLCQWVIILLGQISMNQLYSTDLTDEQWKIIEPLIPDAKEGGRPRSTDMHGVVNALHYISRTGCARHAKNGLWCFDFA